MPLWKEKKVNPCLIASTILELEQSNKNFTFRRNITHTSTPFALSAWLPFDQHVTCAEECYARQGTVRWAEGDAHIWTFQSQLTSIPDHNFASGHAPSVTIVMTPVRTLLVVSCSYALEAVG
jgi:hypothetical protein